MSNRKCSLELQLSPLAIVIVHFKDSLNVHSSLGLHHRAIGRGEAHLLHLLLGVELDGVDSLGRIGVFCRERRGMMEGGREEGGREEGGREGERRGGRERGGREGGGEKRKREKEEKWPNTDRHQCCGCIIMRKELVFRLCGVL